MAETLAGYFTPGAMVDLAGLQINERSALGLSGLFRAVALISGTLASLPLRTLRQTDLEGRTERVKSVFDDPDGPDGQTPYEWKESLFLHALIHGDAFALKIRNEAGGLVRLPLIHPTSVRIDLPSVEDYRRGTLPVGGKWFRLALADGTAVKYDATDVWHMPSISGDGVRGFGLIDLAKQSLVTSVAADRAAAKMFSNGALISGLATPDDENDISDDVPEIRKQLNRSVLGHENAGAIAVVNRRLKFTPWTMSAVDAQFLESRRFQVEEIARWTGVPPFMLMQMDKQSSWAASVEGQTTGLGRTVLGPWASRFEQRASRLLQRPRWCEFDFAGLERPSPDKEIELLIKQVQAGLLTVSEARAIRNLPPLPEPDPAPPEDGDREEAPSNAEAE